MQAIGKIILLLLTGIACGALQGCLWNKVTLLDTKLSYSELCSKDRAHNKCSADGKFNVVFKESRPALPPYKTDLTDDENKNLLVQVIIGKIWNTDTDQITTCDDYNLSSSDYFDAFPGRKIDVSLIKKQS